MHVNEEDALRDRLDLELGALSPGLVPTDAILGQGRAIRRRRRQAWGGALGTLAALAVAASLLVPGAVRGAAPAKPKPGPVVHTFKVDTPEQDKAAQVIGAGTVDGAAWSAQVRLSGAQSIFEGRIGGGSTEGSSEEAAVSAADPLRDVSRLDMSPAGSAKEAVGIAWGEVPSDVGSLEVAYANGATLSYPAVGQAGRMYIAFVEPDDLGIDRLTVYDKAHHELGYSIPFNSAQGATWISWYLPNEVPTQPVASATITQKADGARLADATVRVNVGPFGACFTPGAPGTAPLVCSPPGFPVAKTLGATTMPEPASGGGLLNAAVDRVTAELSDGTTVNLPTVRVGAGKAFWYAFVPGIRVLSLTSYDSTGRQLAYSTVEN